MDAKYQWNNLDDRLFVFLSADVLRGLGFIDIQPQGAGPDGGVDLLATEQLPFVVQGPIPFRWAVQCKFSASGLDAAAVNDQEVRDIEGVLRSSRFATHNLRGYMLFTNRRVTQNVVERLQGIDHASQFRTAIMDGTKLSHHLDTHPRLIAKYFSPRDEQFRALGAPSVIADADKGLTVPMDLSFGERSVRVDGVVDSGATITVIPQDVIDTISPPGMSGVVLATGFSQMTVMSYVLNITVAGCTLVGVRVVAAKIPRAIIGLDILSQFVVLFDGPHGIIKIWPSRNSGEGT